MKREADILRETGAYWVCADRDRYSVWKNGATHAVLDSAYPKTADGLSLAEARCAYLANRAAGRGSTLS